VRIVLPWEQGVRVRGGTATKLLKPGVHMFWPVIGDIITDDCVVDVNTTELQTCTTDDGEAVSVALTLKYRVTDLRALDGSIQDHDRTIANEVCASAASWVAELNHDQIPSMLTDAVFDDVHERLAEWGIDLQAVSLFTFTKAQTLRLLTETR
jgi:regulator of protease activity HflC (stomatin/prohibitin superfamily)